MPTQNEIHAPTADESALALQSSRRLAQVLSSDPDCATVRLEVDGDEPVDPIEIPASLLRLLQGALAEIAEGNAVRLLPVQAELTTQQAADALNVSRPYLVRLLDEGAIPSRKVGTHRRVRLVDVLRYKSEIDRKRLKALDELAAQAQEFDMGYDS